MRIRTTALAAIFVVCGFVVPAVAQYPDQIVKIVVPSPAGGATDVVARIVTEAVTRQLGRQWAIIENVGTAGGAVGVERVARSTPDGYTLLVGGAGNFTVVPAIRKSAYDTVKDFAPVVLLNRTPVIAVANPGFGVASMKDLIARAKAEPGKINYATGGRASFPIWSGWQSPRRLASTWCTCLIAGRPQPLRICSPAMSVSGSSACRRVAPHLKGGKLIAFGVSSADAYPEFAAIPPIGQSFAGFDINGWYALLAPAGTPRSDRVAEQGVSGGARRSGHEGEAERVGAVPGGGKPEVLGALIAKDLTTYRDIATAFNIRGE